jgi:uncharacterized Tic20 family protein
MEPPRCTGKGLAGDLQPLHPLQKHSHPRRHISREWIDAESMSRNLSLPGGILVNRPTADARTLAALAHAGILTNGMNLLGLFGAALIWATQRQRSSYVAGHALQALLFQGMALLFILLSGMLWGGCVLISLTPALIRPELYRTEPPATFWVVLLMGLFILAFAGSTVIYGLLGAWAAWRGRPFHYILVSYLMARQRQDDLDLSPTTMIVPQASSVIANSVPTLPAAPNQAELNMPPPPITATPDLNAPDQEQTGAREE